MVEQDPIKVSFLINQINETEISLGEKKREAYDYIYLPFRVEMDLFELICPLSDSYPRVANIQVF